MMNDKILKLVNALYNNEGCRNQSFGLTLNYEQVIREKSNYNDDYQILNEKGLKKIADELSKKDVTSFNLTVRFNEGQKFDKDGDFDYDIDWYSCSLIFHGQMEIEIAFDMLSRYCSFNDSSFHSSVGEHQITEDKLDVTIQKMVELKNTLLENAIRLINKLSEIKNL